MAQGRGESLRVTVPPVAAAGRARRRGAALRAFLLPAAGLAVLLAAGLLAFSRSPDGSDREDLRPPASAPLPGDRRQELAAGFSRPAPDRQPAGAEGGEAAVLPEADRQLVAELMDSARPLAEREETVAGLGRKGDAGSVATLMALASERAYLNAAAVRALGSVRGESLVPKVRQYLSARLACDDSTLACEAARSLARLKGAAAVPELAAALAANRRRADGHEEIVCSAIVKELGDIGSPAAVPALAAELARSGEKGWSLEYGSTIVRAVRQIGTPEGGAALLAYADRLQACRPGDPLAGRHYDEKIAEARGGQRADAREELHRSQPTR